MTRTNVDIDDQACAEVMRRYRLATKGEAINLALRTLAAETASIKEARSLRGIGWEGDLDAICSSRAPRHLMDTYHGRFRLSGLSNRLTTASSAGSERPKQFQTPREDGRRTARQIEYTKMDGDFDGVSNRLTFSKCLTPEDFSLTLSHSRERVGVRAAPAAEETRARPIAGMPQNVPKCHTNETST